MKILSKRKQEEILKRLNEIKVIDAYNHNIAFRNVLSNKEADTILNNIDNMAENIQAIVDMVKLNM